MTVSLLATKYHCPAPVPDLVVRPRVASLLEAGLHRRLILISAPAGFGKTTLAAGQARSAVGSAGLPPQVAWLSLDAGDNTPLRFWAYLIAALQAVAPTVGLVAQAALQAPQPPPIEPLLTELINDLAGLAHRLLLVLDDYHTISAPAIHQALDVLLEHAPANFCLLITTREDPPLALARLRARGQLAEIRAADLRFSEAETGDFLNTMQALALPGDDVATLVARTEGWITGLRLAALSLQHTDDRHAFVAAFGASHRFLTDYLVDEVLSRQPPHRKAFLLQTALLDRLCGPLCDAMLGLNGDDGPTPSEPGEAGRAAPGARHSYSQRILDELDRANVFLVPLDTQRYWFRYHHLFAEFLRLRLREAEPDLVVQLYRRAIGWCVAHGLTREALDYALVAQEYGQAAELIEALAPELLSNEGPQAVLQSVAALPAALLRQRPMLCVQYAWALTFAGRMAEAANYLAEAESAGGAADAATRPHVLGQVAAHRAYLLFFQGDFMAALQQAQQALLHLPTDDAVLRTRTAVILSSVLRLAGQLEAAEQALIPLADAIQATSNVYIATLYFSSQGEIYQERGRLHQALDTFGQALAFAARYTGRSDIPFTGFAHLAIGHVQREWNNLDAAAASISQGIALCRAWQQADVLAIGLIELAQLYQDRGEYLLARQSLDELRQIAETMASPWGMAMAGTYQARFDLASGDRAAADRWAQASGLTALDTPSFEQTDEYQTLAQLLVLRGDYADAVRVLASLAGQLRAAGRVDRLLAVLAWHARALAGLGRSAEALAVLDEALTLGALGGYVRVFIAGGPPIAELLALRAARPRAGGPSHQYIAQLLAAFPAGHEDGAAAAPEPAGALLEPLSEREQAILRLMAAGLSNRAIGDELYLSANTVRWYASQIFTKLGISGRGAAVARARQLGML